MGEELILSGSSGMKYSYAHTEFGLNVIGAVPAPVAANDNGPTLFVPVVMPKGVTDEYVSYLGSNAYNDFINEMGVPSVRKNGQPAMAAYEQLMGGGKLVTINLRPEDAKVANSTIMMTSTAATKSFWVEKLTGNVYAVKPKVTDETTLAEITLNTYEILPIFVPFNAVNNMEEIDLAIVSHRKVTDPADTVVPMYAMTYVGRGGYGNNYQVMLQRSASSLAGLPLYNSVVFDTAAQTISDKYKVTLARDMYDKGVPVSFKDIFTRMKSKTLKVNYYEESVTMFNDTFILMLDSIIAQLTTQQNTGTLGLDKIIAYASDLRKIYVDGTTDIPALDLLNPLGSTLDVKLNALFKFSGNDTWQFKLANGTDGSIAKMNRFDWGYKTQRPGVTDPTDIYNPLIDMYVKAYTGYYGPEIRTIADFRVDYALDIDYDMLIKDALNKFSLSRPDIPTIFQYPTNITTIEEATVFESSFNPDNRNIFFVLNSYEKLNFIENKPYRIGTAHGLIPNLLSFYFGGMQTSVAGTYLQGVIDGTVRPKLKTAEDHQWCFDNNVNYLTNTSKGWMLDGQASNMKGIEHPYKELYNQLIVGRIMKDVSDFLLIRRHLLDKPGNGVLARLNSDCTTQIINKYKHLIDISYKMYYVDDYARLTGTLRDEFKINGYRTIKRHDVQFNLTND